MPLRICWASNQTFSFSSLFHLLWKCKARELINCYFTHYVTSEVPLKTKGPQTVCALKQFKCVIKWNSAVDYQTTSRFNIFPLNGSFFTFPIPHSPWSSHLCQFFSSNGFSGLPDHMIPIIRLTPSLWSINTSPS